MTHEFHIDTYHRVAVRTTIRCQEFFLQATLDTRIHEMYQTLERLSFHARLNKLTEKPCILNFGSFDYCFFIL